MLTRKPFQAPLRTGNIEYDLDALSRAVTEHFEWLESRGALTISEASFDGVVGGNTPAAGAFTTVRITGGSVTTGGAAVSGYRGLHSFYTTGTDTAWLYSYEGGVDWYNFGIQARSYSFQSNNVESMSIDVNTNVIIGDAAIATNATNGFLYIPTCAGTPSGTPTAYSGRVPIVYDSTNDKIYVYDGGWKATAALT